MATITHTHTDELCEWCGRKSDHPLLTVTIVSPRGAFRDEICESCAKAYDENPEN